MAVLEALPEQFQIGDDVVYLPESIITKITGYVWYEEAGKPPRVALYSLSCGIEVVKDLIAFYIDG